MNQQKAKKLAESNDMEPVAGTVEVEVPLAMLWHTFANPKSWPKWNTCFYWAHNRELVLGKQLIWIFQPIKWWMLYKMPAMAKIIELEPYKKVTWEVTVLPGFYAHHSYHMQDLDNGRSSFGSWEKAYGWSFRLMKKFWIRHFTFVKDRSLEGARYLEHLYRKTGSLDFSAIDAPPSHSDFVRGERVAGKNRQHRALRAGAAEAHFFETEDGVQLKLTRYCGGDKAPAKRGGGSARVRSACRAEVSRPT